MADWTKDWNKYQSDQTDWKKKNFKRLIDDMITFLPVVKPSYTVYTLVQSDLQSQSTTNEPVLQQLVR